MTEHYRLLADETEQRVTRGIYPLPNERFRLMWDNIAPWHQLRKMSGRLTELDANIITASYTYCVGSIEGEYDPYPYDKGDPSNYLAQGLLERIYSG